MKDQIKWLAEAGWDKQVKVKYCWWILVLAMILLLEVEHFHITIDTGVPPDCHTRNRIDYRILEKKRRGLRL